MFLFKRSQSMFLIDNNSSVDVMFYNYFRSLGLRNSKLQPYHRPLIGISGEKVYPMGTVKLEVLIGTWLASRTKRIRFFILEKNVQSAYNMILDRVSLKKFEAVQSTIHQCLKFPTHYGFNVVTGNQIEARECYYTSIDKE